LHGEALSYSSPRLCGSPAPARSDRVPTARLEIEPACIENNLRPCRARDRRQTDRRFRYFIAKALMRLSHPSVYYRLSADQTIEIDCADHSLCIFISFSHITSARERSIPKRFTRKSQ